MCRCVCVGVCREQYLALVGKGDGAVGLRGHLLLGLVLRVHVELGQHLRQRGGKPRVFLANLRCIGEKEAEGAATRRRVSRDNVAYTG